MNTLSNFFSQIGYKEIGLIILVLGIFIDITPAIKFNPIKAIFGYLGKAFNSSMQKEIIDFKKDINEKMDQLQTEQIAQRNTLDKIIADNQNKDISQLRWEVIDFENSLVNGVKHSREQYRHVLDSLEKYINMMGSLDENRHDEYYRAVCENGEAIREHYDKFKNDPSALYF